MAERDTDVLRELFVRIGLDQSEETDEQLRRLGKSLKKRTKEANTFRDTLAALTVAGAFKGLFQAFERIGRGIAGAVQEASGLAAIQEDAEGGLEALLRIQNEFDQQEFEGLKNFASELQNVSRVGDEAILQGLTLAKSFGATNEQAKSLTEAALALSEAQGKSFDESIRQVSKTLGGFAGELGEVNPQIKELTQEELQAGKAAEVLLDQFGGIAARRLNTFSGALAQFQNTLGDAFEEVGKGLNTALVPFLQESRAEIEALFPALRGLGESFGEVFRILRRTFERLGGFAGLENFIDAIAEGLVDAALLFEDFIKWLRGEPSFIGGLVGSPEFETAFAAVENNIADGIAKVLTVVTDAFIRIAPTIFSGIERFIQTLVVRIVDGVIDSFTDSQSAFRLTLQGAGMSLVETVSDLFTFGNGGDTTNNNNQNINVNTNVSMNSNGASNGQLVNEIESAVKQGTAKGTSR